MKTLNIYESQLRLKTQDEVFSYLMSNFAQSIKYWDYFVNWNKVTRNLSGLEMDLNLLNYLVGKENIEEEFKNLLRQHPSISRLIPILIACREKEFSILTDYSGGEFTYRDYTFGSRLDITEEVLSDICVFARETGILNIFINRRIKSVPDYVLGIEVGLDSNGRKSRSGKAMEILLERLISPICNKYNFEYQKQANSKKIQQKWGIELQVDRSRRIFDFVINIGKKIVIVETNYYGGGGSKLKATAGEYKSLFEFTEAHGYGFIWITDGLGWKTSQNALHESFDKLDYIFNLKMVINGALEEALLNG